MSEVSLYCETETFRTARVLFYYQHHRHVCISTEAVSEQGPARSYAFSTCRMSKVPR